MYSFIIKNSQRFLTFTWYVENIISIIKVLPAWIGIINFLFLVLENSANFNKTHKGKNAENTIIEDSMAIYNDTEFEWLFHQFVSDIRVCLIYGDLFLGTKVRNISPTIAAFGEGLRLADVTT